MQDRMLVFARLGVLCVLALSGRFTGAHLRGALRRQDLLHSLLLQREG
jgi:hypothetical protein